MVTRVLILSALVFVGCEKRSTKYCGMHENDLANCPQLDAPPPPQVMCMTDAECMGTYCELAANVCVECLENTHCPQNERCDIGGTYSCRGCILDEHCGGGVCLPGGSCGDDATVIYVGDGVDDGDCTFDAPCATVTYALTHLSSTRNFIHVVGEWTESVLMKNLGMSVTIIAAPGATLTGTGAFALKVEGSIVTVVGLTIECNGDRDGIETAGASTMVLEDVDISGCEHEGGIDLHMGVAKISRSNIHDNAVLGIRSDGGAKLSLVNSWVHHNGTGGISTDADANAIEQTRIEFNTIVDNGVIGIDCKNGFVVPNNIIAANGLLGAANLTGCTAGNSAQGIELSTFAFTNSAMGDYHIGPTSAAKDAAMMTLGIEIDYDGELRPQDMGPDLGADEYKAP